ncbi:MAG: preprotein translocase subunit SecG [Lachnospiraceae bacterium]|nr:preprotein translocase subunit SecG [Lachnospiraceae bacterium]
MGALRIVLTILFIIVCIEIVVLVLMQEGKQAGLGAIAGAAESYWGKNKGRSMEGTLLKLTKICAVLFIGLAIVLNLNVF